MSLKKKASSRRRGANDYWQSYSDMMAALLLMFILIMALTLLRSLRMFEEKNADLERQQVTIAAQRIEIEEQRQKLDDIKGELEEQQLYLDEVKGELAELTKMVGVKSDIIKALQVEFQNSDLFVRVDPQTGAITFDAGIFFSVGSAGISEEGEAFLKEFVPQYLSVLLGNEFRENISEIIIEGHTDTNGTYMYNLDLSQARAYSVVGFCLNERNGVLTAEQIAYLRTILTANGRSYSDPIYDENGQIDPEASRRVVFKFRLKDDEMIEAIQEVLSESND